MFGAIGAIATVAAFFGITNIHQLSSTLSSSTPTPTPVASTDTPAPSPTCTGEYCGEVHFVASGGNSVGPCTASGCPVHETFTNEGSVYGGATATFTYYAMLKGDIEGAVLAQCTVAIPAADHDVVVNAGCTLYSSALSQAQTYETTGWNVAVNNP